MPIRWYAHSGGALEDLKSSSGWLIVSLGFHLAILGLLTLIKLGGGVLQTREFIQIETDIVESFERVEPITRRHVLDLEAGPILAEQRVAALKRAVGSAPAGAVEIMAVDKLDLGSLNLDLLGKGGLGMGDLSPRGVGVGAKLTTAVDLGQPKDYQAVLDAAAKAILKIVADQDQRLLVVLLFDESRSLLEDRKIVSAQLERIFHDLKFALKEEEERRLKWAVVSFSSKPTLWLPPTGSIKAVQEAIAKIKIDITGIENPIAGIQFCIDKWRRDVNRMMIMVISDEAGDDVAPTPDPKTGKLGPHPIEQTIDLVRKSNAAVFVLGREASFLRQSVYETITIDGQTDGNWVNRGLITCKAETLLANDFWIRGHHIPGGFGCYPLSALASQTGGQFFILSEKPSPYDEERLEAYQPEWCTPSEYERRAQQSRLRATILRICEEYNTTGNTPYYYRHIEKDVKKELEVLSALMTQADQRAQWCEKAIADLQAVAALRSREQYARKRWEANFDLLLAQLHRIQFLAIQYHEVIKRLHQWIQQHNRLPHDPEGKEFIRYWVTDHSPQNVADKTLGLGGFHGGPKAQRLLQAAQRAFEYVEQQHPGTPWAATAKLHKDIRPVGLNMTTVPEEPHRARPAM